MNKIDEIAVWINLLGFTPTVGIKFKSPFRSDKNPGASLRLFNNKLYFTDFADSTYNNLTCVSAYALYHSITEKEAFKLLINKNYKLKTNSITRDCNYIEAPKKEIVPDLKKLSKAGLEYWNLRGVIDLENVSECKGFSVTTEEYSCFIHKKELTFHYQFSKGFKLYSPYPLPENKKYKFLSKVRAFDWWWYNENTDTVLIVKASKDYLIIKSILVEYDINITLTHLQSETVSNNKNTFPNLSKLKNYNRIYTCLDNDDCGIKSSAICEEVLGSISLFTPVDKDIDEMYISRGRESVVTWLLKSLEQG